MWRDLFGFALVALLLGLAFTAGLTALLALVGGGM